MNKSKTYSHETYPHFLVDPCPKGWRVPDGGDNGLWIKALGPRDIFHGPWDDIKKGMDFTGMLSDAAEVWYPAAGNFIHYIGLSADEGKTGKYWSCTAESSGLSLAYSLYFYDNGIVHFDGTDYPASALSVRCIRE